LFVKINLFYLKESGGDDENKTPSRKGKEDENKIKIIHKTSNFKNV